MFFLFLEKIIGILFIIISLSCWSHPSAEDHYKDFKAIFNGYGDDSQFRNFTKNIISTGIDSDKTVNALPYEFKKRGLKLPGNDHRLLGHGWTLNDDIPKNVLKVLKQANPGREKEIIDVWRTFARHINDEAIKVTGLKDKAAAKAFASLIYDIHLLGDLETDNTMIKNVLKPQRIVKHIEKNVRTLFGPRSKYASVIRKKLKDVLKASKGRGDQYLADALMDGLYSLHMGDMLKDVWGDSLKIRYSVKSARAAELSILTRPVKKIPGLVKVPADIRKIASKRDIKFVRGFLQEHHIRGRIVRTLSIPISPALASGGSAGVMTLFFSEGETIYRFAKGNITESEFILESKNNCGEALVIGSATYVLVALGAAPGGWGVVGIGVVTSLMYNIAFKAVVREFSTPSITMDDILGKLPVEFQQRRGAFNYEGFQAFFEMNQKRFSALDIAEKQRSPLEWKREHSALDFFETRKSPLEMRNRRVK